MTLALDGSSTFAQGEATSATVTLSTSTANDIIIVCINILEPALVTSVTDTAGLTWQLRGSHTDNEGTTEYEYWANSASILTSDVITINFTSSNFFYALAFGISGANTTTPWDTNDLLPIESNADPTPLNTNAGHTFIFAATRSDTADTGYAPGAGWTQVPNGFDGFGFWIVEYQIVTSQQSGLSVDFSPAGHAVNVMADAIIQNNNVVIAESGSASDTVSAAYLVRIIETGSASATASVTTSTWAGTIAENGNASDSVIDVGSTFLSAITESGSASDTSSGFFSASISESGNASDTVVDAGSIFVGAITENGSAGVSVGATITSTHAIVESGSASDSCSASGRFVSFITSGVVSPTSASLNTTNATLLVMATGDFGSAPTVSDSKGNTWTAVSAPVINGSYYLQQYYVNSATPIVGIGHTFTVSGSGAQSGCVAAFSGTGATPLDAAAPTNGTGTGTTLQASASLTSSQNGSLIISATMNGGGADTYSINSSFTITNQTTFSSGVENVALAYLIQSTTTASDPTWSNLPGSGVPEAMQNVAFDSQTVLTASIVESSGGLLHTAVPVGLPLYAWTDPQGNGSQAPNLTTIMGQAPTYMTVYMSEYPPGSPPSDPSIAGWQHITAFLIDSSTPGVIPIISWPLGYSDSVDGTADLFTEIANGATTIALNLAITYDVLIQETLAQWKAAGFNTLVIRLAEEMNGDWNSWLVTTANVAEFQLAWQHFYAVVHAYGAANGMNITVNWCPNVGYWYSTPGVTVAEYYPGNAYVDSIGIDDYGDSSGTEYINATLLDTEANFGSLGGQGLYYLPTTMVAMGIANSKPISAAEIGGTSATFAQTFVELLVANPTVTIKFFCWWNNPASSGGTQWEWTNPSDDQGVTGSGLVATGTTPGTWAGYWAAGFGTGGSVVNSTGSGATDTVNFVTGSNVFGTIVEFGFGNDYPNVTASTWHGIITEAGSANATVTAGNSTALQAITETGSAGDTTSLSYIAGATNTESGSASDAVNVTTSTWVGTITERGSASDSVSDAGSTFNSAIAEAGSASDSAQGVFLWAAANTESGSASDTVNFTTSTWAGTITETGSASDSVSDVGSTFNSAISEVGSASDIVQSGSGTNSSITESGSASDSVQATYITNSAITETGSPSDTVNEAASTYLSHATETGNASDSATAAASTWVGAVVETGAANDQANTNTGVTVGLIVETGDATDTVSEFPTAFVGYIIETGSASDTPSITISTWNGIILETGLASDSVSDAGSTFVGAIAESGLATDKVSLGASPMTGIIVETGSASDTVNETASVWFSTITETGSASDTVNETASIWTTAIIEAGSASDTVSEAPSTFVCAITESGSASDTTSEQRLIFAAIVESGSASDTAAVVATQLMATILEFGTAVAIANGNANYFVRIIENDFISDFVTSGEFVPPIIGPNHNRRRNAISPISSRIANSPDPSRFQPN